jgi:hypothetical protein
VTHGPAWRHLVEPRLPGLVVRSGAARQRGQRARPARRATSCSAGRTTATCRSTCRGTASRP